MTTRNTRPATFLAGLLIGLLGVLPSRAADDRLPDGAAASPSAIDRGLKAGDWLVRGGIIGAFPTLQRASIGMIGGRVDTPTALLPDGSVSYFLTDHIAIEGQVGAVLTRPKIRDSLIGDVAIGSIRNASAVGIVQYHFLPDAAVNPYVGVGVNATWPIAIEPAPGIADFKLASLTAAVLQAGFDMNLTGNWFANASLKYILAPRSGYDIGGVKVQVDMNMLIVGAGLGYRF